MSLKAAALRSELFERGVVLKEKAKPCGGSDLLVTMERLDFDLALTHLGVSLGADSPEDELDT